MPKPPDILTMGAREAIVALQREELRVGNRLRQDHESRFRSFREQLRRAFLSHFVLKVVPDRETVQVWDAVKATRDDLPRQLTEQLVTLTEEIEEADQILFEDTLDEAFVTGYRRELWLLTMGGLPGGQYASQLPDETFRTGLLIAAGVGGLSWLERLRRWRRWHVDRTSRWVASAVVGEQSLADTEFMTQAMERQYVRHVQGLLGNELHRAAGLGSTAALSVARRDFAIAEVWVTMDDGLVCPICEPLHLTVTDLQPVTDSHPGCRCWKVPVPAEYEPSRISYEEFLSSLEED